MLACSGAHHGEKVVTSAREHRHVVEHALLALSQGEQRSGRDVEVASDILLPTFCGCQQAPLATTQFMLERSTETLRDVRRRESGIEHGFSERLHRSAQLFLELAPCLRHLLRQRRYRQSALESRAIAELVVLDTQAAKRALREGLDDRARPPRHTDHRLASKRHCHGVRLGEVRQLGGARDVPHGR
jgi:hypothetical protein